MKRCLWAGMLGLLVGVAPTWATYTAVDNTQDGEFGGELTHAELLEDVYSPDVAWSAWSSGALQGYTNGWLWAIRVDDTDVSFNDKTWPAARYEVRSVARYSGHSTAWYGYDVGSGFVESLTMDYGGGWGKPGFCVVDVASGTLEWNLKRHDTTVLSSNSVTDYLVTYVITPDPTIDLEDDADHWLLCWEEYLASGNDDYNDAVWDVRKAPEIPEEPVFFSREMPLGHAESDIRFLKTIFVAPLIAGDRSDADIAEWAEYYADAVEDAINDVRQNQAGNFNSSKVVVDFASFGVSGNPGHVPLSTFNVGIRLFYHPDDAMSSLPFPYGSNNEVTVYDSASGIYRTVSDWSWNVPWSAYGVVEASKWSDAFIDHYNDLRTSDPTLPAPYRLAIDSEPRDFNESNCVRTFANMTQDARWDDPLPGQYGKSAKDLYSEFLATHSPPTGFPSSAEPSVILAQVDTTKLDPPYNYYNPSATNKVWGLWYIKLRTEAREQALNDGLFSHFRNEYEGCLCSNYQSSAWADNVGRRVHTNCSQFFSPARGRSDLLAPVLYPNTSGCAGSYVAALDITLPSDQNEASLWWSRNYINTSLYSFGGNAPWRITPWITLIGCTGGGDSEPADREFTSGLLAACYAKGVREFNMWHAASVNTANNWNTFYMLVDHIWGASLASTSPVTINEGTGRQADAALLEYALNEYYVVESDTVGTDEVAEFDVTFETDFDYPVRDLRVYLETTALDYWGGYEDVTAYVSVYNTGTLSFDAAGNVTIPCSGGVYERQEVYFDLDNAADYFDASADVVVRVRYESDGAFLSMTDLVQIVGANEKEVIYVDSGATGADDGTSWTNAYDDLQDALDYAADNVTDSMEIWVAAGTYTPGALATDTFELVDGVRVFGGFDGAETTLAERDVATNVTILSGDLGSSVYSQHVVKIIDCGADTLLDGFTVTDGVATGLYPGGGLYITGGAPVVSDCIITGNSSANVGGGVYLNDADAAFVDCTITANTAGNSGGGLYSTTGDVSLTDCVIDANTATASLGGGVHITSGGIVAIRCAVTDNTASVIGGGAYTDAAASFADCLFAGNTATSVSGGYGGGLFAAGVTTVVGSTFVDNSADTLGGGIFFYGTTMTLDNSIVYGNTAAGSPQISDAAGNVTATYCDVEAGWGGPGCCNINNDPLFTDDTNGDYTLTLNSPCVDAGYNTNVPEDSDTDLAGEDRIVDGDGDTTETVDMGCYEYQPS